MKCPSCGSANIVWKSKEGMIVCSDCGLVIDDKVYDYRPTYLNEVKSTTSSLQYNNEKIDNCKIIAKKVRILNNYKPNGSQSIAKSNNILALELLKMNSNALKIYNVMNDKGYLSGKQIKTKVAVSFYLSGYNSNRMKSILEKLQINEKYFRKTIKTLTMKEKIKIIEMANIE
jgi:transcription initiation factor TFIIIB Brf1 subunit/transcription initiation factor TFIIB